MNSTIMVARQLALHAFLAIAGLAAGLTTSGAAALIRTEFSSVDAIRFAAGLASFAVLASALVVLTDRSDDRQPTLAAIPSAD